jgi:hypothetical protein
MRGNRFRELPDAGHVGILHDWWRANGRQMREHLGTQETTR